MADALTELSKLIAGGLPAPEGGARPRLEALFGNRYYQRFSNQVSIRDPLSLRLMFHSLASSILIIRPLVLMVVPA